MSSVRLQPLGSSRPHARRFESMDFGDPWRAYLCGRGESVTRGDRRERELEVRSPFPPLARPHK